MPVIDSLRERLLKTFGVDLPIRGGRGTEAAPIVVSAGDLQEAVDVQMQVLRCLGTGSGTAWRLVAQEVVAPQEKVVRANIESMVEQDHKVIARPEAIYFVLEALPPDAATTSLPSSSGFMDPRSGIRLPGQLGWLHFSGATDNEPNSPGLGWSIAYESRAMQGTVYVYDRQERQDTDDVESERVVDEFRTAVADALNVNPAAGIKYQAVFKDATGRGRCLLAIVDLPGHSMSAVLLTVVNGWFVKAHLAFDASEREFGRMAHESMQAFVDAVRPERATTS